jgi:hypothetical protein
MTDPERAPIPQDLQDAFSHAVQAYDDDLWDVSLPWKQLIPFRGQAHSINEICDLVLTYGGADKVPEALASMLLLTQFRAERIDLVDDGTYAWAARYLLQLMRDRIERQKRQDELRHGR